MKILVISIIWLLLAAMVFFPLLGRWSLARVSGILAAILLLFSIWRRKYKGLLTVLLCVLFVVYVGVYLWLYPVGIVSDGALFMLTFLVCALSLWEVYRYSKWHRKGQAQTTKTQDGKMH